MVRAVAAIGVRTARMFAMGVKLADSSYRMVGSAGSNEAAGFEPQSLRDNWRAERTLHPPRPCRCRQPIYNPSSGHASWNGSSLWPTATGRVFAEGGSRWEISAVCVWEPFPI